MGKARRCPFSLVKFLQVALATKPNNGFYGDNFRSLGGMALP